MPHELGKAEIERLLTAQSHAHLGCSVDDVPYVVPISYVFNGHSLFGYTHPGRKIEILRKNPRVCVQVDDIGLDQWLSVVVNGEFQELRGAERTHAIQLLGPKITNPDTGKMPFLRDELIGGTSPNTKSAIFYRINITSMTGRQFGGLAGAD